jgi:UDP-N-acetylglucosamine 2-epimerase (non-hydrolysing)
MRTVMTIVGTRPEVIKMCRVIDRLDGVFKHVLVHTGQNHDPRLNQVFFDDLEIRPPDYFLNAAEGSAAATIAAVITRSDALFEQIRPEALLIYGDTNSGLCVIPAKRRRIPVFHMEAGNRCFDQRVPEELNRKVIDHLSDVNMVLTEHARRYLLDEGLPGDRIFKVGSHLSEVLQHYSAKIERSTVLDTLGLSADGYFIVSLHREENVDDPKRLEQLVAALDSIAREYSLPVVVSTHPRTRARLDEAGRRARSPLVRFLPPFAYTDYVRLQQSAYCVVSDSGTIFEEASLLNLPAVTIRDAHERPEGIDAGTLVVSSIQPQRIVDAIRVVRTSFTRGLPNAHSVPDYAAPAVSETVVRIVASYIDIVNETVWRRALPALDTQEESERIPS